jgi:hypothetical protein
MYNEHYRFRWFSTSDQNSTNSTYTHTHTHTHTYMQFCFLTNHAHNWSWSGCENWICSLSGHYLQHSHARTPFCTCSGSCHFGHCRCFTNVVQNNMSATTLTETTTWLSLNRGWQLRCRKIITCTPTSSSSEMQRICHFGRLKPYNTPLVSTFCLTSCVRRVVCSYSDLQSQKELTSL